MIFRPALSAGAFWHVALTAGSSLTETGTRRRSNGRKGLWIKEKQYDKAAVDLELSIALEANADACECDPYSQLLWTYFDGLGDLDKRWALVRRAQSNRRWLMPELVEKPKAASPR